MRRRVVLAIVGALLIGGALGARAVIGSGRSAQLGRSLGSETPSLVPAQPIDSTGRRDTGARGGGPVPSRTGAPSAPAPRPPRPPGPGGLITRTGTAGVALTFDDGPVWVYTEQILTLLREHGVKATFCVIGKMAASYPQRIQQIVRGGHTLCNHSWGHEMDLGKRSEAEIRSNLQRANDAIRAAAPGARITYFRHPGGHWTPRAIQVARELGMAPLHWEVDPRDWERPGAAAISERVISQTRAGSIVLLHDGGGDRSGTVEALRTILPTLKSRFALVPMPPRSLAP